MYIENMMSSIGLPMQFKVMECYCKGSADCPCTNNAFASMDSQGERYIVYDNTFLESFDSDTIHYGSLAILAHEVGHHLAAHSLSLNYYRYEHAVMTCDPRSPNYDPQLCNDAYSFEYSSYLDKSRQQELEADRFAGFIMASLNADFTASLAFYNTLSTSTDINSTHPSRQKRISAFSIGYELASEDEVISDGTIDLQMVKGRSFVLKISDLSEIERAKLIEEILTVSYQAAGEVADKAEEGFLRGGCNFPTIDSRKVLSDYHKVMISPEHFQNDTMYFTTNIGDGIHHYYNERICTSTLLGMEIKRGILKVILFEEDHHRVLYKSLFDRNSISFPEIKSVLVELYQDELELSILRYNQSKE